MKHSLTETRSILLVCALIASVATGGSLYFSEVMGLYPCDLCWIQRIAMYPLVVVFAVAAYEDRLAVWRTALPLSVGGGLVAAYHSVIQLTPASSCSVGGCGNVQFELFGMLSIPNLSLSAFAIITAVLAVSVVRERR
jgi:disulfide bond formation protein DsbB